VRLGYSSRGQATEDRSRNLNKRVRFYRNRKLDWCRSSGGCRPAKFVNFTDFGTARSKTTICGIGFAAIFARVSQPGSLAGLSQIGKVYRLGCCAWWVLTFSGRPFASQCGHVFGCPSRPSCLCSKVARVPFVSCLIATTYMLSKSLRSQSSTCLTSAASAP
jgi:hypothetical protein